ncbi:hypothetical protein F5X99DRAFT_422356 [Biscogniauxia marginata]|nr:hypothetical protein F5X99DRAFT_422356 [Biscogniauxia marginata]
MALASNHEYQRQSRWVELFDPEKYYPFVRLLSSYLTIADFLLLCQACKGLDVLKGFMLRKFSNINVRLRDFVDDPVMFRSQLGNYGALISGPFALNIFELGRHQVLYLDVFIKDGANADQFTDYIQETEKYQNDNQKVETTPTRCIYSSCVRPGMKLRITRTNGSPIRAILTSTYTTACVNFITWNKAYSIFPQQTLINHQFYPLRSLDDGFGSNLNELASQGWTTRNMIWPDLAGEEVGKIEGLRRVGDSSTLVILLNTDSIQAPSTPDFVIDYAQFDISGSNWQNFYHPNRFSQSQSQQLLGNTGTRNRFLKIQAEDMSLSAVRHSYTISSSFWKSYVTERLRRWAWLELYKLKSENRPLQSTDVYPLISDVFIPQAFKMPRSWDFADDQIPQWYHEWEAMNM